MIQQVSAISEWIRSCFSLLYVYFLKKFLLRLIAEFLTAPICKEILEDKQGHGYPNTACHFGFGFFLFSLPFFISLRKFDFMKIIAN